MDEENKSKNFNLFSDIYKLRKVKKAIGTSNPKDVENEMFAKLGCYNEKEKIEFEAKYIKSKLSQEANKKVSYVDSNIKVIDLILDNLNEVRLKDISKIKRYLVLLELKFDLKIGFVSEVDSIYDEKVNELKLYNDSDNKYPIDYIISLDDKESDKNNKKREL